MATHAVKFFPTRDQDLVSDEQLRELLGMSGLRSVDLDDEREFDRVTRRDINRAVDNRWPIYLRVDDAVLGEFRAQCFCLDLGKVRVDTPFIREQIAGIAA